MSEIWGLQYANVVERGQLKFFKMLLSLPVNTPDSFVRVETGRSHVICKILKRTLRWWSKLLEMSEEKLPKQCYNKLLQIIDFKSVPFNWAKDVRVILRELGAKNVWDCQNLDSENLKSLIDSINNHYLSKDIEFILNSSFNKYFRRVSNLGIPEAYLYYNINFCKLKLISQLRMASKKYSRIVVNRERIQFNKNVYCRCCGTGEKEDLPHFLLYCPALSPYRAIYLDKYITSNNMLDNLESMLSDLDINKINNVYLFVINSLKFIKFMLT